MRPPDIVYPDETQWLAARNDQRELCIGASHVATICGENPYEDAYTLYHRMLGRARNESNYAMRRGLAMEDFLSREYERETGAQLTDPGPYAVWAHPDLPWLRCTPDRLAVAEDLVVELKTTAQRGLAQQIREGESWGYRLQVQAQIQIVGASGGDLAIDDGVLSVVGVERDDQLWAHMLRLIVDFRARLVRRDPPKPDARSWSTIQGLYPDTSGETVILSEEADAAASRAVELRDAIRAAKKEVKPLEDELAECEAVVAAEMGPAEHAQGLTTVANWRILERKGYAVEPSKYRRLTIKKETRDDN